MLVMISCKDCVEGEDRHHKLADNEIEDALCHSDQDWDEELQSHLYSTN